MSDGYYRFPTISGDLICFISEDDLWLISSKGGKSQRLTSDEGRCSCPSISPDGKWIAFSSQKEGFLEVFCISTAGGISKRITYLGSVSRVLGWKSNREILFYSNFENPNDFNIYTSSIQGGEPIQLPVGDANRISFAKSGGAVALGRCNKDSARWKRYRGGTVGNIWLKKNSKELFKPVVDLKSDLSDPMIVGNRLYFLSDHEGIANLYSCNFDGEDISKHSNQTQFYARNAKSDGVSIIYHAGGNLFIYNSSTSEERMLEVDYCSSYPLLQRAFDSPEDCLHGLDLSPDGSELAASFRGKLVTCENWFGPSIQLGHRQGVRYRMPTWLHNKKTIVATSDELNGEDRIVAFDLSKKNRLFLSKLEVGIVRSIMASPKDEKIALTNHRNELIIIDLDKKKKVKLEVSDHGRIRDVNWSPDGKWLVYTYRNTPASSVIRLIRLSTRQKTDLTNTVRYDHSAVFSMDGLFVYFAGEREFLAQYDAQLFDMSFAYSTRLYAISLLKSQRNPFTYEKKREEEDSDENSDEDSDKKKKPKLIKIDLDSIQDRILQLPLPVGSYSGLNAAKEELLYYSSIRDLKSIGGDGEKTKLMSFDFNKLVSSTVLSEVDHYCLSMDRKKMAYMVSDSLYVTKAGDEAKESAKNPYSPEGGKINLDRIKVEVDRKAEWQQMFKEAWLRQREHFWTENMSDVDWVSVYERYFPLLEKVGSRSEFSDLVWEMQGELGTSHCYEFGGDYQASHHYNLGRLGCNYRQDRNGKYFLKEIWSGDPTKKREQSPLKELGFSMASGDQIIAINGRELGKELSPREALLEHANSNVLIEIRKKGKKKKEEFVVKAVGSDAPILYRQWVEQNREYVHQKTKGRIGYVHIPDMVANGYAEFHRYFLTECELDGLIVDVRYNSGGHVSQLILERLSRKRIGYDKVRWSKRAEPYPLYSIAGPVIGLTNEWAGSDGDIFSHSFKMLKLGPLVGKRTWGGVIGITCQYSMVDGGITSQPEYSFWFDDVGWGVENYGTDPDVEVTITPEDSSKGLDTQLDKSIEIAMESLKKNPQKRPNLNNRPKLTLPKL